MGRIETREALVEALHDAARLEHALCCSYLFAAFSLKRTPEEGGVDWAEIKEIRDWTDALLIVARQEMEHLGIVGNLLISIGAGPEFDRHAFPWRPERPADLPELTLAPFSVETIDRFVAFERPDFVHLSEILCAQTADWSFEDGLALTVSRLRADADWDAGEAWARGEDGVWAPVAGTLSLPFGDAAGFKAAAAARMQAKPPGALPETHAWAGGVMVVAPVAAAAGDPAQAAILIGHSGSGGAHDAEMIGELMRGTLHHRPGWRPSGASGAPSLADRLLKSPRKGSAASGLGQEEDAPPATLGAFYRGILGGFRRLGPSVFTGPTALEGLDAAFSLVRPGWFDMNFAVIKDLDGVREAIDQIIEEGEGSPHPGATPFADPEAIEASHYERFLIIRAALDTVGGPDFAPARAVIHDPEAAAVTAAPTRALMALLDRIYAVMLRMLTLYYAGVKDGPDGASPGHDALPPAFLPLMSMAMRTLGETLTRCGVQEGPDGRAEGPARAGAAFSAPPPLAQGPADAEHLDRILAELEALSAEAGRLASGDHGWRIADDPKEARRRIADVSANLRRTAVNLRAALDGAAKATLEGIGR